MDTKNINTSQPVFIVRENESGQKLLQLLVHRFHLNQSLLHRWIRTGQVRANGSRSKPFDRVVQGDTIRVPPFAFTLRDQVLAQKQHSKEPLPREIGRYQDIIAYDKPSGLPTHCGSKHSDSLASRLEANCEDSSFVPVPCHRLDKDTSGVLLVATSYASLRAISDAFANRSIQKEYLCWVWGKWKFCERIFLRDTLAKMHDGKKERMGVSFDSGKESVTEIEPLALFSTKSLLRIRLHTGRTHQIRVQLAHAGYPVIHDAKYGDPKKERGKLLLHAYRITLPCGVTFSSFPQWDPPYDAIAKFVHDPL